MMNNSMTRQPVPAPAWQDRVAHWRSSGLLAQAYASEHGIVVERLTYWASLPLQLIPA